MLYIGDRPSLNDGRGVVIELNIFDFDEDIYDQQLTPFTLSTTCAATSN